MEHEKYFSCVSWELVGNKNENKTLVKSPNKNLTLLKSHLLSFYIYLLECNKYLLIGEFYNHPQTSGL